jgi:pyridoxamine 5'-phosphate oxidase like protein
MPLPNELEQKFWKALKSDMTMMLGIDGIEDGHARPMTAQLDGEGGPIWFFTAKDNTLVRNSRTKFAEWGACHCHLYLERSRSLCNRPWDTECG